MKTMRTVCVTVLGSALAASAWAQGFGGPQPTGLDKTFTALLGKNTTFSATTKTTIKDAGANTVTMEVDIAALDGKIRAETDLAKIQTAQITPQMIAQLQAVGMDKMCALYLPDKKTSYAIYPTLKAYLQMPAAAQPAAPADEDKIEKTEIGKETIDGHVCIKNKITITNKDGKLEGTTWEATDLNHFPIQMEFMAGGGVNTVRFANIKLAKPDAALFNLPADYQGFKTQQEFGAFVAQRMFQPGGAK